MAVYNKCSGTAILLLLVMLAAYCDTRSAPTVAHARSSSEKIFNVLRYGANANGRTDSSLSFIRAWRAACDYNGMASLLIPLGKFLAGPTIFQGPCQGLGPIVVRFVGNVKALADLSSYAEDYWILFENIKGLIISGRGCLNGQGNLVWKYNDRKTNSSSDPFPITLKLNNVTDGNVRQITSVNPMGFHIAVLESRNIMLSNLHLNAPSDSPNTDGIHISRSSHIKIVRSIIATGDDCIGIIGGSTDISVNKLICGPGHGISIGSLGKYLDEKDVRGIIVENCTLHGTANGIRIKTWADSPPSQASNFTFQGIIMDNVSNPIIIDQSYGSNSTKPSRVKISEIQYSNIVGTSASDVAVKIDCSAKFPCQRVQMSNINLKYIGMAEKLSSSVCSNVNPIYFGHQFPPGCV